MLLSLKNDIEKQMLSQLRAMMISTLLSAWNLKSFYQFKQVFSHTKILPPPSPAWLKRPFSTTKKSQEVFKISFSWPSSVVFGNTFPTKMENKYFCGGRGTDFPADFPSVHLVVFLRRAATRCNNPHGKIQPTVLRSDEHEKRQDFWKPLTPLLPSRLLITVDQQPRSSSGSKMIYSDTMVNVQKSSKLGKLRNTLWDFAVGKSCLTTPGSRSKLSLRCLKP